MNVNSWDITNPRLWYRDDLVNHPELIPLEGQTINIEEASGISKVYPGSVLITEPITTLRDGVFKNNTMEVRVDRYDGLYLPIGLFDEPLSIENISHVTEQWLTGDSDINKVHYITITMDEPVMLTEYWMMAAVGTKDRIDARHPTPNRWLILGSIDAENWELVDSRTALDDSWKCWQFNTYSVKCEKEYTHFKFAFIAWNPTEDNEASSTGLKRLYAFGRPKNKFIVPNIPSPDDAFVWVIPNKEIINE